MDIAELDYDPDVGVENETTEQETE
jgi:hypothetical protein